MPRNPVTVTGKRKIRLRDYSPKSKGPFKNEKEAQAALEKSVKEIGELQDRLFASSTYGVLLVFQGMDTAGKSTAIKCLMSEVHALGCEVVSFKSPSSEELLHDYMWRCSKEMPQRGQIKVFDRSYYEEVVAVRVHPEFLEKQRIPAPVSGKDIWKRRFKDIRHFEEYLEENGIVVIKFFLHLSRAEQRRRLARRLRKPEKNWKFSLHDIEERRFWRQYQKANEEAINGTATAHAPWHILPSDKKVYARAMAAQFIVERLRKLKLKFPIMDKDEHRKNMRRFRRMLKEENGKK